MIESTTCSILERRNDLQALRFFESGCLVSVKRDAGRRKPWISAGVARSEAHRPDNGAPPDSMRITAAGTGLPDWTGAVSNNWAAVASLPYSSLRAIVGAHRSNMLED